MYKPLPLKEGVNMEDLIKEVNEKFPISFKKYKFADKIHKKYPLIKKSEIALIAKAMFEVIRESAIKGESVMAKNIFNEFHFIITNNKKFDFLKVSNRTLPIIRKRAPKDEE